MALAPEVLAAIQALLDIGVDIKKGLKAGGVVAALLGDADLIAKLEVVGSKLTSIPSDVSVLALSDAPALLSAVVVGVENIIAA
jgi:hypothetical protein